MCVLFVWCIRIASHALRMGLCLRFMPIQMHDNGRHFDSFCAICTEKYIYGPGTGHYSTLARWAGNEVPATEWHIITFSNMSVALVRCVSRIGLVLSFLSSATALFLACDVLRIIAPMPFVCTYEQMGDSVRRINTHTHTQTTRYYLINIVIV